MARSRLFILCGWILCAASWAAASDFTPGPVSARHGVLYRQDGSEVSLWGVNYEFNLSWEYRTYFQPMGVPLTIDALEAIADRDFADLAALKVQIVRVHLLPADFTDRDGRLVDTVFLQALDYLVENCRRHGMYVYITLFNRMGNDVRKDSFAAGRFGEQGRRDRLKSPYLFDPTLVSDYERYLGELMRRRNPLTGIRYADDPAIAVWELMNEPEYPTLDELGEPGFERIQADWLAWRASHPGAGSVALFGDYQHDRIRRFIDLSCATIRGAGGRQPIFWNFNWPGFIEEHPEIAAAARDSQVDGVSFCLYPGQNELPHPIDYRHLPSLTERNFLPMLRPGAIPWPELIRTRSAGKAVVVYEFEAWCNNSAYIYPAMARLFRELGAQIACMWEYDPAITAEYNLVASHFLNLRASPAKAASFLVAEEVFHHYPRGGRFPHERFDPTEFRFGPFGASFAADTSWFVGQDTLLYSRGLPAAVAAALAPGRTWRLIAGTGKSPFVDVSGNGLYWLEKTSSGYRLTLLPTAEVIADLWADVWNGLPPKKIRFHEEPRHVTIRLPGRAEDFAARPGRYDLSADGPRVR